jgi:hypothetical protein
MPKPKQKRIIVLQSSNHDSGSGSLRDAIATSQDESTESESQDSLTGEGCSNGNDSSESGVGNDILIGEYSEIPPIFEIITLPPRPPYPRLSFTDTIDGELFCSGASSVETTLFLPSIQRSREAVSEFSGVSLVEATLLPASQNIREHAHFSGVSSVETTFTSISVNNTLGVIL